MNLVTHTILTISSVPWRESNLRALLDDVAAQTVPPSEVVLVLDGYPTVPELPEVSSWQHVIHNAQARGPGERWKVLAQTRGRLALDGVALVIDDDFRLRPGYIERTLREFQMLNAEKLTATSWSGALMSDGDYINTGGVWPSELYSISAGSCALKLAWLAGITDYPFAGDYFKVGGDDEALVSYHLWRKGITMKRPPGSAPLKSVEKLANDERSSGLLYGFDRVRSRMRLHDEHGWTTFKLPPSLRRADWKKKPWE